MAARPTPPPEPDAGHIPITEEFDSAKYRMPKLLPMAIAMLLVAAVIGIGAYLLRAKPIVSGTIDDAFAVTIPNQQGSLAIVNLSFRNITKEPLRLINVNVAVHAKGSVYSDDFGSAADYPRYFQAFPALEPHAKPGLFRDTKIAPQQSATGSVIVSLPLTPEEFNARDSMTVRLTFDGGATGKIISGKAQ